MERAGPGAGRRNSGAASSSHAPVQDQYRQQVGNWRLKIMRKSSHQVLNYSCVKKIYIAIKFMLLMTPGAGRHRDPGQNRRQSQ